MLKQHPPLALACDLEETTCPGPQFPLRWSKGNAISLLHWPLETLAALCPSQCPRPPGCELGVWAGAVTLSDREDLGAFSVPSQERFGLDYLHTKWCVNNILMCFQHRIRLESKLPLILTRIEF